MWQTDIQDIEKDKGQKFFVNEKHRTLTFAEIISNWQTNTDFRAFFIDLLADAPFNAFFWETPPVTQSTLQLPFEFVLIDSPELAHVQAEPHFFEEHFRQASEEVITFLNLGKDARLVAPCPVTDHAAYPHLAAFVRKAPVSQIHALWQKVGEIMEKNVRNRPVWLSTSGLGVYWLHIRLDAHPKYYQHQPYKSDMRF